MKATIKYLLKIIILNMLMVSCQQDVEPESNTPNNPGNINADEVSEYLALKDASKITGSLPSATDGQLKINFKDTIYLVKDFPYGARVVVKHNALHDISGFFVGISNSSFYYDVPVLEGEAGDSTDVIYIDLDIPSDDKIEYPYTIPIKILPHGPDNIPIDEFEKRVVIEDPEKDKCPITVPKTSSYLYWEWEFTVGINYAGEVFQVDAPGLRKISQYKTGGCCNADGTSSTVGNDPNCFEKFSDGSLNAKWRSIDVEHYFQWAFDLVEIFDDGTFEQFNHSDQTNYRPSLSDFCNNVAAYDEVHLDFIRTGTHDFIPGADYVNIKYDVTDPPVFGKNLFSGEIEYTCHSLIITSGREEKWSAVFRKFVNDHSPLAFGEWD